MGRSAAINRKLSWLIIRLALILISGYWLGLLTGATASASPEAASIRVLILGSDPRTVITLDFENYLKNVLPNEWIASWPGESLRAGALAVRTYGWHYTMYPVYGDADLDDWMQRYIPGTAHPRTDAALSDTWGIHMEHDGYMIDAQYREETGNPTQSWQYYWGYDNGHYYLYLASVSDPHTGPPTNGPGMCQWGSKDYAEWGYNYSSITSHYYTNIVNMVSTDWQFNAWAWDEASGQLSDYWKQTEGYQLANFGMEPCCTRPHRWSPEDENGYWELLPAFDPQMLSPLTAIPTWSYHYLVVRMSSYNNIDPVAQLYWDYGGGFSEQNSLSFSVYNDGSWNTYYYQIPWASGVVQRLRFDPVRNGYGNLGVDYISIVP